MKLTRIYTQIDRNSEEKRGTLIAEGESSEHLVYFEENSEEYKVASEKLEKVKFFEYDPRFFEERNLNNFNVNKPLEQVVNEELTEKSLKI